MSQFYKLHQLIEMAQSGKQFEASRKGGIDWYTQETFKIKPNMNTQYFDKDVIADWTVTFKREPRILWVNENRLTEKSDGEYFVDYNSPGSHKKPIKFIEVLEE
jgi:hypothetical protein